MTSFLKYLGLGKKKSKNYSQTDRDIKDIIGADNLSNSDLNLSLSSSPDYELTPKRDKDFASGRFSFTEERISESSTVNITSVVNKPIKKSLLKDLYQIFQEHAFDIQNTLNPMRIEDVAEKDFESYINSVRKACATYNKRNAKKTKKFQLKNLDIENSLYACYQKVPAEFFSEKYNLEFKQLVSKPKKDLLTIQEEWNDYLDSVEVNLHYQIMERFNRFLDVILGINKMEIEIRDSLKSIRFFKNFNQELKRDYCKQVMQVNTSIKRKKNIEMTLNILNTLKEIYSLPEKIKAFLAQSKYDAAIKCYRSMELISSKSLAQVKSISKNTINSQGEKLRKLFTDELDQKWTDMITPNFFYSKANKFNITDVSITVLEESFVNVNGIDTFIDDKPLHNFHWTIIEIPELNMRRQELAARFSEFLRIGNYPSSSFASKLLEFQSQLHNQFKSDMELHLATQKDEHKGEDTPDIFNLKIKFILFYFELYKRFFKFHINNVCNFINAAANLHLKDGLRTNFEKQVEIVNLNLSLTQIFQLTKDVIKTFGEKIVDLVKILQLHKINLTLFAKAVAVFEEIEAYFMKFFFLEETWLNFITIKDPTVKAHFINIIKTWIMNTNVEFIKKNLTDLKENFVLLIHTDRIQNIKTELEKESWMPVSIPYNYGLFFETIVEPIYDEALERSPHQEDLLLSSRPDLMNMDYIQKLAMEDDKLDTTIDDLGMRLKSPMSRMQIKLPQDHKGNEPDFMKTLKSPTAVNKVKSVSIKKNCIVIDDKSYRIGTGFFPFVQSLYDYINLLLRFKSIQFSITPKLIEMIYFFNTHTRWLVLETGATSFGVAKKITAKALGLCLTSIKLISHLMRPINEKLKKKLGTSYVNFEQNVVSLENELNKHVADLSLKIIKLIRARVNEQCREIEVLNWAMEEKFVIPTKNTATILHSIRQLVLMIEDVVITEELTKITIQLIEDLRGSFVVTFENLKVTNYLSAKRVKEELEYFADDLGQLVLFQIPEVKYDKFKEKIASVIDNKCSALLKENA